MIARLPDELAAELERTGDKPLCVENPRNHKRYLIIAEESVPAGASGGDWTPAKNSRRFELIDREIEHTITVEESAELQRLNAEIDEFLRRTAPLPLPAVRELHDQLTRARNNAAS